MAEYTGNFRGIGEMLRSPGMIADMGRRAEQMRAAAVAASPVDTGLYVASFETSSGVDDGRAYGQLANTATWVTPSTGLVTGYAVDVEFGSVERDLPEYAPLRRSMDAAG